jgi:hypothetical protein
MLLSEGPFGSPELSVLLQRTHGIPGLQGRYRKNRKGTF